MLNVIIIIILNPYHAGRLRTVIKEFIKGTFNALNLFFTSGKLSLLNVFIPRGRGSFKIPSLALMLKNLPSVQAMSANLSELFFAKYHFESL